MTFMEGKRVWLTRSEEGNRAWQAPVLATGAEPISLPCLRFQFLTENANSVQTQVSGADWVVFSSPRGVQAVLELGIQLDSKQRIACVGEKTAIACADLPMQPELVAKDACASGMATELLAIEGWQSAALVGAEDPRPELTERLFGRDAREPLHTGIPDDQQALLVGLECTVGGECINDVDRCLLG